MDIDMIEVDPKLFVTCRLCLQDQGQYQIVPSVQQQIKFCFDIDVEPFDGLPQLICTKCNNVLVNFHAIKKTFLDKQNALKSKLSTKSDASQIQPQQDTVTSSQQMSDHSEDFVIVRPKKKRKKLQLSLSSCSDNESEKSLPLKESSVESKSTETTHAWKEDYKKQIACKLCHSPWITNRSVWSHIRSHAQLKANYKNILRKQCFVKLTKIDNKPNITGENNIVVHSKNKLVESSTSDFYIIYSKVSKMLNTPTIPNSDLNLENTCKDNTSSSDSSDNDDIISTRRQRKRRLLSKSSNETVVIESNKLPDLEGTQSTVDDIGNEELHNNLCINIDSSDSDSERTNSNASPRVKTPIARLSDYKTIHGIINNCLRAYNKKNETEDTDITNIRKEIHLKHKLLSIGRKIINKQGFNCTGLLRYMEHKNLDIVWIPPLTQKESCVRILTKLRGDDTKDENQGWTKVKSPVIIRSPVIRSKSKVSPQTQGSISTFDTTQSGVQKPSSEDAVLYYDNNAVNIDIKKLLNANPVANPKQLPKKLANANESKGIATQQNGSTTSGNDLNYCMPIITSTTSLAPVTSKEPKDDNNKALGSSSDIGVPAPRIKVKPVSELMSERTLSRLMNEQSASDANINTTVSKIDNVWPNQRPINVFVTNLSPQPPPTQNIKKVVMPCVSVYAKGDPTPNSIVSVDRTDYVILDTVELPNAKVESPFQYLKQLLQVHSIILLNPCDVLTSDFVCLIKFKVVFKQEPNKDQPVVLCLSLLCYKNCFCMKVKDRNQQDIDIHRISANWQWEILQIYRGEVGGQILQNAQKVNQETFDFTNKFFCLLKSIASMPVRPVTLR